jgi:PLP dependent protein
MTSMSVECYHQVVQRVRGAAQSANRDPDAVQLVVVSKTFGIDDIQPVLQTGHRMFGENRVQEATAKWPMLRERYRDVELHLIGPLQSNKAGEAVALFDVIQTIDRPKIVAAVAEEMRKQNRNVQLFVQINTGDESQKAGVKLKDAPAFIDHCKQVFAIAGLMCIPPATDSAAKHFKVLSQLALAHGIQSLSMGMSADYETAIQHGATHVRVGSAIFGQRSAGVPMVAK